MSVSSTPSETAPQDLLKKLRAALQRDGDFPASARIVNELRLLVSNPKTTANQLTEVILREPSLGTRILHLVNSSFYRRAKQIMTVSQAVLQIGMKPLAEMCAGLVLLQKFVPMARRGSAFTSCLQKTVVTSLLSSSFSVESKGARSGAQFETGYLAGSFIELGSLLLAYYFPAIYEAAAKHSKAKGLTLGDSIKAVSGVSPIQLSLEVISALNLPDFYSEIIKSVGELQDGSVQPSAVDNGSVKFLFAAESISDVLVSKKEKSELDGALLHVRMVTGIEPEKIGKVVGSLPTLFKDQCLSLDVTLPSLPDFVVDYADPSKAGLNNSANSEESLTRFSEEIKQSIESGEPTSSVITTVMETLSWGMGFDRVLLMLMGSGKRKLVGRMLLGKIDGFNPRTFERPTGKEAAPYSPDSEAINQSRPVFQGQPLFEDGWPFVAVPVGFGARCIGVIYADKIGKGTSAELSGKEQAFVAVLSELLDRAVSNV